LIVGATVEAYDAAGTLVDSTTTDANGQYELTVADASSARIVLNTEGDINYNGEPLHASAEQTGFSAGDTVNFNFDETTATSGISVNGESITVVSALEGESSSVIEVGNLAQLQAMQGDLDADYKLIRNIDASETETWNNGQGFNPVGTYDVEQANFTGSFDGQNHTIRNLSINRLYNNDIGLFGAIGASGEVKNVGVINVNMTGDWYVGGLVGENDGTVSNSYSTGNVTGESYVGGLLGVNRDGNISNSYSTGNFTGESYVGGLLGSNDGTVSNSYSTGNVTGGGAVGGLVGDNYEGNISNSYSTGNVTGGGAVGGLVGYNDGVTVSNSYWDTEATGQSSSAGLPDSNGLTTSQMQGSSASSSMSGFDFTSTWSTVEGDYPELQWQE
jgi:hypothetical protein